MNFIRTTNMLCATTTLTLLTASAVAQHCPQLPQNTAWQPNVALGAIAGDDIVDTAVDAGSFNTLVAAVKAAGLVETLKGEGPFTVFAPTDDAFAKLPKGTVESLLKPENKDQLVAILTYHVVSGRVNSDQAIEAGVATTLQGGDVRIRVMDEEAMVNDAGLISTDIEASNGVIHVIDTVLMPPKNIVETAAQAGSFSTLIAAVKAAGLEVPLRADGPFTVLAPTDEAFSKLPAELLENLLLPRNSDQLKKILLFHVADGRVNATQALSARKVSAKSGGDLRFNLRAGQLVVNDTRILINDIAASNGVIHAIDQVLIPPDFDLADLQPDGDLLIGIFPDHLGSQKREMLRLGRGEGIEISQVSSDGGARAAGLLDGDVILLIDGVIATSSELDSAKERVGAGGTITLVIAREVEVEVRLDH